MTDRSVAVDRRDSAAGFWSLARRDFAVAFRGWRLLAIAVLVIVPTALGLIEAESGVFRDRLAIYSVLMISPIMLVFPLLISLVTTSRAYSSVTKRFVANTRSRIDIRSFVAAKILGSAGAGFVVGFATAGVPAFVAFVLWPRWGDPYIDLEPYRLTPTSVLADSYGRTSFSELLRWGNGTYALSYSCWVGLLAAALTVLGVLAILVLRNHVVAMLAPMLFYFIETLVASFADHPFLGLMFAAFPFGLRQQPILSAAAPGLIFVILTVLLAVRVLRNAPENGNLQ